MRTLVPPRHLDRALTAPASWWRWLLVGALLVLGAFLFLHHAFSYFMYDDEGSYAYAAWRIASGELPYRDFLSPQLPVFLYWGGLLVSLFGRSYVALRVATMAVTLVGAYLLYRLVRQLLGASVATLALALYLIEPNVFHNARFFRPEAYMLLFSLIGLNAVARAEQDARLFWWALAGVGFSLAILSKLFGFLPLGGCFLYLLIVWLFEKRPFRLVLRQGLALGLPVLLIVGGVALVFYGLEPYFITAVFEHHTMQGEKLTLFSQLAKVARFYVDFIISRPVASGLAALGAYLLLRRGKGAPRLLIWQLPTALAFLPLSRDLMPRHFTYLAPVLVALAAYALVWLTSRPWLCTPLPGRRIAPKGPVWGLRLATVALAMAAVLPWAQEDGVLTQWYEDGSDDLAALVRELAGRDGVVMADYPGINFAAGRRSTYWASGLSGGAAESGQIQGAALIEELEQDSVQVVIINTFCGAHQMTEMQGYDQFRSYVQKHYALVARPSVGYSEFEVYSQRDTMALNPDAVFAWELALTGVDLEQTSIPADLSLEMHTRWQALTSIKRNYSVSLRLVDEFGYIWGQSDGPLIERVSRYVDDGAREKRTTLPTSTWSEEQVVLQGHTVPVKAGTPPGHYYLTSRVYELDTGQVLAVEEGEQFVNGDLLISEVEILPPTESAKVEDLPISTVIYRPVADSLELAGSGPLADQVTAGRELALDLFWYATGTPEDDYDVCFNLLQNDQVVQSWELPMVRDYPTFAWREGEVVLGRYHLDLDPSLAGGDYQLRVLATDEAGLVGGASVALGTITVRPKPDLSALEDGSAHALSGVTFGRLGELAGYTLDIVEGNVGREALLTLYWRAQQPSEAPLKVFVHLVEEDGGIPAQQDGEPDGGATPTNTWSPGEVIVDQHHIALPTDMLPGVLSVKLGLYDPQTGQRLGVTAEGLRVEDNALVLPDGIRVGTQ
ncbi:MAG: ArnT family glycosyltransferase [Anaerolineae bacterium]